MSLWVMSKPAAEPDEKAKAETEELRRQVRVMNRALNQIQRGMLSGECDWHRKIAKDALHEACGEVWT